MMRRIFVGVLLICVVLAFSPFAFAFTSEDVKRWHETAWERVADMCLEGRYEAKMGIYSARSLMVKHPEYYLQMDRLYIKLFERAKGIINLKEMLREDPFASYHDPERFYTYWNATCQSLMKEEEDIPQDAREFSWDYYDEISFTPVSLNDFYDSSAYIFPILDLRLPFFWNTLWNREEPRKIPRVSMAEALYLRALDEGYSDAYLLITDKGYAYPYYGGALHDYETSEVIEGIPPEAGKVFLVMNEENVWYPLFGRDDRDKDSVLSGIVSAYCEENYVPELSEFESEVIEKLKYGTDNANETEEGWLKAAAGHAYGPRLFSAQELLDFYNPFVPEYFWTYGPSLGNPPDTFYMVYVTTFIVCNSLSPNASVLAAILEENEDDPAKALRALSERYLSWFELTDGRPGCDYFDNWEPNLDDKLISQAGVCRSEATNVASAFWLVQVPGWKVFTPNWWKVDGSGGHVITGICDTKTGFKGRLSNGVYEHYSPLDSSKSDGEPRVVFGNVVDAVSLNFVMFREYIDSQYNYLWTTFSSREEAYDFVKELFELEPTFVIAKEFHPTEGMLKKVKRKPFIPFPYPSFRPFRGYGYWDYYDSFESWRADADSKEVIDMRISFEPSEVPPAPSSGGGGCSVGEENIGELLMLFVPSLLVLFKRRRRL